MQSPARKRLIRIPPIRRFCVPAGRPYLQDPVPGSPENVEKQEGPLPLTGNASLSARRFGIPRANPSGSLHH
jgi:hypothetical protein